MVGRFIKEGISRVSKVLNIVLFYLINISQSISEIRSLHRVLRDLKVQANTHQVVDVNKLRTLPVVVALY
jgi:hypothetical protein